MSIKNFKDDIEKFNVALKGIDKHLFSRIVSNIINNAIEANNDSNKNVTVDMNRCDQFLTVNIKDEGPGIPETEISKVLQRGYTTKKTGSGLGLTHAYQEIARNGGKLELNNENGLRVSLKFKILTKKWNI